jgi:hypothetical protein
VRKALLFMSAFAVIIAPLTAASVASASTHYSITIGVTPDDFDTSPGHEHDKVTIHGTVSGGPVSGKSVHIYRVNTTAPSYDPTKAPTDLGTTKLSSSGKYSMTDHPPRGGYWIYTATKSASGGNATKTHHLWVYQWDSMGVFYDDGALNLPDADTNLVGHQKTGLPSAAKLQGTPNGSDKGRYDDAYWVDGGGSLVINSVGNRCKGVTFHIGVSAKHEDEVDNSINFKYTVYKGEKAVFSHRMHQGDPMYVMTQADRKSFGEQNADGNFRLKVDAVEGQDKLRFVVGTPKIACTYPDDSIFD